MSIRRIINTFKGLFTNADTEDIEKEYLTVCKNLWSNNGKLEKDFGFGLKIADNTKTLVNIFTFLSEKFGDGYLYIGIAISSNVVTLYGYDTGTDLWDPINDITEVSFSGTYYSVDEITPIIQSYDTVRIYGGAAGELVSNVVSPIWLGWIDRDFFDESYSPTALFYDYDVFLDAPDVEALNLRYTIESDGSMAADTYYYKFSYLYDGRQETLLSDAITVVIAGSQYIKFTLNFTTTGHNKRITAIRVYRATALDGNYERIQTVDYIRTENDFKSGVNAVVGSQSATVSRIYIPFYDGETIPSSTARITIDGDGPYTVTAGATGTLTGIFTVTADFTADQYDNTSWKLEYDSGGWITDEEDTSGAYGGYNFVFTVDETGEGNLDDGILIWDTAGTELYRDIVFNYKKAIKYLGTNLTNNDKSWKAVYEATGLWYYYASGGTTYLVFYDKNFTAGADHPLDREEVSIKTNGEFVHYFNNRTWLVNGISDVGNTNEERPEWIFYSELNQPDVIPAGNAKFITKGSGKYTGVASLVDYLFLLKESSIVVLATGNNYSDPTLWSERLVTSSIGNIAKYGYIEVLEKIYIVNWDGIYVISANQAATSEKTPVELLRVSEAINDLFVGDSAMSDANKKAVKAHYNSYKSEIIYTFGSSIYAYDVITGDWRQLLQSLTVTAFALDEAANVLVYQVSDKKVYSTGEKAAVTIQMRTKVFTNAREQHGVLNVESSVNYVSITYQSATALTVKIYPDHDTANAARTFTLPITATPITVNLRIAIRCEKHQLDISDAVASKTNTFIGKIKIIIG